jgi:hypothetical protein
MITADRLRVMSALTKRDLMDILDRSGYTMCTFKAAEFLGITNGGEFCYKVTYFDDQGTGKDAVGKVFVKYDLGTGAMTAEF